MSRIRTLANFDFYTKSQTDTQVVNLSPPTDLTDYYTKTQTDSNIVSLSPPTDLTPYYTSTQVDGIMTAFKGTASVDFDTLGEIETGLDNNELSVVSNAAAIVAAQNQIITNHP